MGNFILSVSVAVADNVWRLAQYGKFKRNLIMKAEEIKTELEKNYGWNFSSEETMEMYYELFLDVQKVVLCQPPVVGRSEQFYCWDEEAIQQRCETPCDVCRGSKMERVKQ
jgi:hypothetical protein